jgi:hypothetical protein
MTWFAQLHASLSYHQTPIGRTRRYNGVRQGLSLTGAFLALSILSACGPLSSGGAGGQVSASPTPTALPPTATPAPGVSPQFLANIDGSAFYIGTAPSDASPTISQADAETLARDFPPTNGVVNSSMLGECVWASGKSYLCWIIDGTSGKPSPVSHIGGPVAVSPGATPIPDTVVYETFYVAVDAQPGSPTANTIVSAGGSNGRT